VRVLVVEDEKKLAGFVKKSLQEAGMTVDVSHNGDEALMLAEDTPFDAIVLDVMLPGRDGLSILRKLREQRNCVPVLLVTARAGVSERIEGLNMGADDYLAKPFSTGELIARLHAICRRKRNRIAAARVCAAGVSVALARPGSVPHADLRARVGLSLRPGDKPGGCLYPAAAPEDR
jgi:DNA-binding response OmpR family regulator